MVRSLKDRLRSRHNVAVTELSESAGLWQRASLAVVSVAERREPLERLFETIVRESEAHVPGHLVETGRDYLDGADAGPGGWGDDVP